VNILFEPKYLSLFWLYYLTNDIKSSSLEIGVTIQLKWADISLNDCVSSRDNDEGCGAVKIRLGLLLVL